MKALRAPQNSLPTAAAPSPVQTASLGAQASAATPGASSLASETSTSSSPSATATAAVINNCPQQKFDLGEGFAADPHVATMACLVGAYPGKALKADGTPTDKKCDLSIGFDTQGQIAYGVINEADMPATGRARSRCSARPAARPSGLVMRSSRVSSYDGTRSEGQVLSFNSALYGGDSNDGHLPPLALVSQTKATVNRLANGQLVLKYQYKWVGTSDFPAFDVSCASDPIR